MIYGKSGEPIDMATVKFSVPPALEAEFNETFKDQNTSAIIADLMREAIDRAQRQQRHTKAVEHILARHRLAPRASDEELRAIRAEGRP
jgi:hypothetical protein